MTCASGEARLLSESALPARADNIDAAKVLGSKAPGVEPAFGSMRNFVQRYFSVVTGRSADRIIILLMIAGACSYVAA